MNKRRLLKLADFLETVPRRKFDLKLWITSAPTKPEGAREGSCGFAGCAIGWAAHAKLFRGFKLDGYEAGCSGPTYRDNYGFTAVSKLFGLRHNGDAVGVNNAHPDAHHLFVDEAYPGYRATPKQVAKRIRKFVSEAV